MAGKVEGHIWSTLGAKAEPPSPRCEPILTARTLSVTIRTVRTRLGPLRAQHFQAVVPGGSIDSDLPMKRSRRVKRTEPDKGTSGRVSQTAPESKSLSAAVWGYLEAQPGFTAGLREAEADLEAGRGTRYEVRGNALHRVQSKG